MVCCFVEQKMVDDAEPFPAVLERVVAWLQERELGTKHKYAILTDGYAQTCCYMCLYVCWFCKNLNFCCFDFRSWDMSKFLNIQCQISRIRYPQFAKKWINIRKSYRNFYKVRISIL